MPDKLLSLADEDRPEESSQALVTKTAHLKEKLTKLPSELERLKVIEKRMMASSDQQISRSSFLFDGDSGRGSDRSQLAKMARR